MAPNVAPAIAGRTARRAAAAAIAAIGTAVTSSACGPDGAMGARPAVTLQRVSGDGQTGAAGATLGRPLVARLVDAGGRPVRRVDVRWTVTAGQVVPQTSATNADGEASTVWHLGETPGPQHAYAEAEGLAPVEFVATVEPVIDPESVPLHALTLATYDGSGQAVHPDVALPLDALDGRARLAITPYPWGNPGWENPSLFASADRETWVVPAGVTNPIVRPQTGYLSDPDLVWLADRHELWMYYRHVDAENEILFVRSADGVQWSPPQLVVHAPNHQAVSPAVVRRAAEDWWMWTVNAGDAGCGAPSTTVEVRRSADGVTWSAPRTVSLAQPGVYPWHIDVQWIASRGEYWALFNGKLAGSCTTDALYIATSTDGVTWRTFPSPILRRGAIPEFADVVYRATLSYDADRDLVSLWHSGARYTSRGYEWRAAYEQRRRTELFDAAARPFVASRASTTAPPLTNATAP